MQLGIKGGSWSIPAICFKRWDLVHEMINAKWIIDCACRNAGAFLWMSSLHLRLYVVGKAPDTYYIVCRTRVCCY